MVIAGGSLTTAAHWVAYESLLFNDEESPFRASMLAGAPRLLVVAGENASGKSLFSRMLCARLHGTGLLPISISIRERTGAGDSGMGGMRRVFMLGDESDQSTGATSVQVVRSGFRNVKQKKESTLLALDEPELGLSDGYARAFGQYIGGQARETPKQCAGVVVVTHSRSLVAGLLGGYGEPPTFVLLDGDADLQRWLATPEVRTVEQLLALPELGLTRWRRINELSDQIKKHPTER